MRSNNHKNVNSLNVKKKRMVPISTYAFAIKLRYRVPSA